MKRRLTRAKTKIKAAGIRSAARRAPASRPPDAVLAVLYLIFNEGYGGRSTRRRSHPSRARAHRSAAGRTGGTRSARAHAAPPCPAARCFSGGRPCAARRSGPHALGHARDRDGTGGCSTGRSRWAVAAPTSIQAAIAVAADGRADRLAADRRAVPAAGRPDRLAGGRAQPRGRGGRGRRPGRGAARGRCISTWTATSTSTPPAASCCGASAATTKPARRHRRALDLATSAPERRFLSRRLEQF